MSKLSVRFACGTVLVAGWIAGTAGPVHAVPEVAASRVIDLALPNSQEKTPVISSVALDPTGKLLAAVGDDHLVRVFDVQSGQLVHRWKAHIDWVKASAFQPEGRLLATSGADRQIRLWEATAESRPHDLAEPLQVVYTLVFSPDGRTLAAAGFDDKVCVFDADSGRLLRDLAAPGSDIRAISFSPDGARMAAAGRTGFVRIWEASSGRQMADVRVSSRRICALAYVAGRKTLGGGRSAAHRAAVGWLVGQAPGRSAGATRRGAGALFLRARHARLGRQRERDPSLGRPYATERCRLVGHTGSITTLVFEGHAGSLISGSFDTTVRLWTLSVLDQDKVTRKPDKEKVSQRNGPARAE